MYFFSIGNRLCQNIKFRETPERQCDMCSGSGIRTDPAKPRAEGFHASYFCGPLPQGSESLRHLPVVITSLPSLPRRDHGGIKKADPCP